MDVIGIDARVARDQVMAVPPRHRDGAAIERSGCRTHGGRAAGYPRRGDCVRLHAAPNEIRRRIWLGRTLYRIERRISAPPRQHVLIGRRIVDVVRRFIRAVCDFLL